jgi:hypothetical protein
LRTVFNGPWIVEIALRSGPTHFRCFTALLAIFEFSHHMCETIGAVLQRNHLLCDATEASDHLKVVE